MADTEKETPTAVSDGDAEEKAEKLYQEFMEHPAFAKEIDPSKPMNAAFQGLQALKFEDDNPHQCALNYKVEGNHYFGRRKYDVAIANYNRALELEVDDRQLKAVLLTNRATCNFYLKNYRRCINDCAAAKEQNAGHLKLYLRAAMAAKELQKPTECRQWVDAGLQVDAADEQLLQLRSDVQQMQKAQRAERRRAKADEWKELNTNVSVFKRLLKERGLRFEPDEALAQSLPDGVQVVVDAVGRLHWPVLLLYPEAGSTDLLRDVVDTSTLLECVQQVFGADQEPPPWDRQRRYSPASVEVYFEEGSEDRHRLDLTATIEEVTRHPRFVVHGQLLSFVVVSTASEPFYSSWVR